MYKRSAHAANAANVSNPAGDCNPFCGQGVDNPLPPDLPTSALAAIADARRAAIEAAPEAAEPKDAIEARLDAAQRRRCAAFAPAAESAPAAETPPADAAPRRPPMSALELADHWRVRCQTDAAERAARAARRGDLICTANRTARTDFEKGIAKLARLALEYAA